MNIRIPIFTLKTVVATSTIQATTYTVTNTNANDPEIMLEGALKSNFNYFISNQPIFVFQCQHNFAGVRN